MKRRLIDVLGCPVCKGTLELNVEQEEASEIIRGFLYCSIYCVRYPIEDDIPNLSPHGRYSLSKP
jgi:uncharacterized protein YbaR (Trm112 family)